MRFTRNSRKAVNEPGTSGRIVKHSRAYPGQPRKLSKTAWFYEQGNGITVVQEVRKEGQHVATVMVVIPWNKLCLAVDNHRAVKGKTLRGTG